MPRKPQLFSLPAEAHKPLRALLKKGVHPARKLNRARILLKLGEGLGPAQIAREVGVCEATVYNVRKRANQQGWKAAIEEQTRSGRPPTFSGEDRALVTALACSDPPEGHVRWSLRLLADHAVE